MQFLVNIHEGDPYDVYIGRRGHGEEGYFGNPVMLYQDCPVCKDIHTDRGDTLPCYAKYHYSRLRTDPLYRQRVLDLDGKILGCFCHPKPCHGRILLESIQLLKNPLAHISKILPSYQFENLVAVIEIGDHVYIRKYGATPCELSFSQNPQEGWLPCGPLFYKVTPQKKKKLLTLF